MFRPDWENVVTPVIDFALKQPSVDPKRIALMGISLGGVLAPRAAAFERRLAALIANDGVYDFSAPFRSTVPPEKWEPFVQAPKADSAPQVDQLLESLAKKSPTREMRGGPDKVIVYVNGVLCAMDREAKVTIPVSRWKLAEIGVACFLAALKGNGTVPQPVEAVPLAEPLEALASPQALLEPDPTPSRQQAPEPQWEHFLREMRDLSR